MNLPKHTQKSDKKNCGRKQPQFRCADFLFLILSYWECCKWSIWRIAKGNIPACNFHFVRTYLGTGSSLIFSYQHCTKLSNLLRAQALKSLCRLGVAPSGSTQPLSMWKGKKESLLLQGVCTRLPTAWAIILPIEKYWLKGTVVC
jgi:hypothetical protein